MDKPVIFDVDDFCDMWECLTDIEILKHTYPNFKATLFTIPFRTSPAMLLRVKKLGYVELAVHGFLHSPNLMEMLGLEKWQIVELFKKVDFRFYCHGFRPPGWHMNQTVVDACNEAGLWVAMHRNDRKLAAKCIHGYYIAEDKYPCWHGHTHNVCNNWIRKAIPDLVKRWPQDQEFMFVSEAVQKT
jgi:hypothetical protein